MGANVLNILDKEISQSKESKFQRSKGENDSQKPMGYKIKEKKNLGF